MKPKPKEENFFFVVFNLFWLRLIFLNRVCQQFLQFNQSNTRCFMLTLLSHTVLKTISTWIAHLRAWACASSRCATASFVRTGAHIAWTMKMNKTLTTTVTNLDTSYFGVICKLCTFLLRGDVRIILMPVHIV